MTPVNQARTFYRKLVTQPRISILALLALRVYTPEVESNTMIFVLRSHLGPLRTSSLDSCLGNNILTT